MALARYLADGTLDPSFGVGGLVTAAFDADSSAEALAVQPDGAIVVVGRIDGERSTDFAVVRFTANGTLDQRFGAGGLVTSDLGGEESASAVTLLPDGRAVVAGRTMSGGSARADIVQSGPDPRTRMAVARYLPDGAPDPAFGTRGVTTFDFGGQHAAATAMTLQTDGALLLAGTADSGGSEQFALARLTADGALDPHFGTGGRVTVDVGGEGRAQALAVQADGSIIVAGTVYLSTGRTQTALARVH